MKVRNLVWSLWTLAISLVLCACVLIFASRPDAPTYAYSVEGTFIGPTFATLGALILSRRPGNVIGWIFLAAGVLGGVQMFSGEYATVALAPNGPALPGGALSAWLSTVAQSSSVVSILFLVLLFPDGRLLSRRWRPVAWISGLVIAVFLAMLALSPGPFTDFPSASNPFGVEGMTLPRAVQNAGQLVLLGCYVAAILSLVLRFHRSRGEKRQQIKWFAYAAALGFAAILFGSVLVPDEIDDLFGRLVWTVAPLSLPVSAAVAILRYRLYDIDRIINRTLVYATLTVMLVLVYLGSIVSIQYFFQTFAGGDSELAVVASTLGIAALFNPLRRRVQAFVDRRFYRRKYDAAKVLRDLSARLRDETDLAALDAELMAAVARTVAPAYASLWLREGKHA